MDPPDLSTHDPSDFAGAPSQGEIPDPLSGDPGDETEPNWLEEVVARLEADPDECWPALESLSAVDEETRARVIAALADFGERPGVRDLLRLLGSARDPAVRSAAALGLAPHREPARMIGLGSTGEQVGPGLPPADTSAGLPAAPADRSDRDLVEDDPLPATRLARSLVTAIDGDGRGTIVVSVHAGGYRRTAAFRCDIRRGLLDVVGEVEEEHPAAGRMVEEWIQQADGHHVLDAPELAVRVLEGCYLLSGPDVADSVRAWLEATIGLARHRPGTRDALAGPRLEAVPDHEMTRCAERVLDACPEWLDRSALTRELAREIALREGSATPDPIRDAGAYRYLFEHLLIGRLDLYARMLLWMAWLWHADGRPELARSAFALAAQLSDEQYAVPSHPFAVALTTRSLVAARARVLDKNGSCAEV